MAGPLTTCACIRTASGRRAPRACVGSLDCACGYARDERGRAVCSRRMAERNAPVKVAFQGERGAYSEEAARRLLGESAETVAQRSFEEMFEAVARGETLCAAVPIENSLAGSVHKNYDLLLEHDLTIIGEVNVRIVHNLIAPRKLGLADVRRVYSHPVALAQCEKFFRANPHIEAAAAYDTAGSVK